MIFDATRATNETIVHYEEKNKTFQRVFAGSSFGQTKSKTFSILIIEADNNEFWFAQVHLLFKLTTEEDKPCPKKEVPIQYFNI